MKRSLALRTLAGAVGYGVAAEVVGGRWALAGDVPTHTVRTRDGWPLEVAEYPGSGERGVVYLQHGLSSNRRVYDLHPHGPSLARWLSEQGYKVFAGNLMRFLGIA